MTIYYSEIEDGVTVWIELDGVRSYETSASSLEEAIGQMMIDLANRDTRARPKIQLVEAR
jgi:hypothetical protein